MAELGIENLKEVNEGLIDLGDITGDVLEDGVDSSDFQHALKLMAALEKLGDLDDAWKELLDLDAMEDAVLTEHMSEYVKSKIEDAEEDAVEIIVSNIMTAARSLGVAFTTIKKIKTVQ